jgi:hypothetical protein
MASAPATASIDTGPASASAAFARGDYAAAEQAYGALLMSKPKPEPGVLSGWAVNRANCLLRLGRTEDADRACRLALRLQPENADAHEMLATALHRMATKGGQPWRVFEEVIVKKINGGYPFPTMSSLIQTFNFLDLR